MEILKDIIQHLNYLRLNNHCNMCSITINNIMGDRNEDVIRNILRDIAIASDECGNKIIVDGVYYELFNINKLHNTVKRINSVRLTVERINSQMVISYGLLHESAYVEPEFFDDYNIKETYNCAEFIEKFLGLKKEIDINEFMNLLLS